jgi:hypothetical protein
LEGKIMETSSSLVRLPVATDDAQKLPLDHPLRRRSLLLTLASLSTLKACGGSADSSIASTFTLTKSSVEGTQGATAAISTPYVWKELSKLKPTDPTYPLPVVDGVGLLSYKGKLWMIGGWGLLPKNTTNAVWCSEDGITWINVKPDTYNTESFNPAVDWEGRHCFGCVVFKDRMWIIGGDDQKLNLGITPEPQKDIWSSDDGVNWSREGDLPFVYGGDPPQRTVMGAVVFKAKNDLNESIWLLGGHPGQNDNWSYNDIWKSTDGINWNKVTTSGQMWSPRVLFHHVAAFKDKLWVIGGDIYNTDTRYNDVYSSRDGKVWKLEQIQCPWSGRRFGEVAVFDGKLWLFTGWNPANPERDSAGNLDDVWYSTDGINWTRYQNMPTPVEPSTGNQLGRHASGVAVHGNTLRVVAGNMWNDSWMLSPYTWEKVPQTAAPHFGARDGLCAVSNGSSTAPKMWLLGGFRYDHSWIESNEVWSSTDASTWALAKAETYKPGFDASKDWAGRQMMSAAYFQNKIWIVGGFNRAAGYITDVWNSSNGKTWTRVADGLPWLNRCLHSVVVFNKKIWVLGGQNNVYAGGVPSKTPAPNVYFNDVWNSSDGTTWTQVTASAPWLGRGLIYGSVVFKNRLWVIGGGRYAAPNPFTGELCLNDVWSTADGVNWTQHTANAPWLARRSQAVCVFDNRMWVIGGYEKGYLTNDVWSSEDGVNWAQLPAAPSDTWSAMWPVFDAAVVVHMGIPHLIGGVGKSDVWRLKRLT